MLKITRVAADADLKQIYLHEMDEKRLNNHNCKIILSVPDQSSHKAETDMVKHFGGIGFSGIEVLTFHQIARKFTNTDESKYLNTSGKMMLLYKALNNAGLDDSIFAASIDKIGFLENIMSMISEFKRYCVSLDELNQMKESIENKMLREKLNAICSAYEQYNELFEEYGYIDSEDDLSVAANNIKSSDYFSGAAVWFVGFSDFLPQHYEVINSMLYCGAEINVYLLSTPDTNDFKLIDNTIDKLIMLCRENNVAFDIIQNDTRINRDAALSYFADNYFSSNEKYSKDCSAISIKNFISRYEEAEAAAELITDLIYDEGFKYSDICVACADFDSYHTLCSSLFTEYKIPFFCDRKKPASEHNISALLSFIFDILDTKRSYDSVMGFLKTGLVCPYTLTDNDIDDIENYVLKRGIRDNMWDSPEYWKCSEYHIFDDALGEYKTKYLQGDDSAEETPLVPEWEKLRCFSDALCKFCAEASKKHTASEFGDILFELFDKIDLYDAVEKNIEKYTGTDIASHYALVWNMLVELCEQANDVLGGERQTFEDYSKFLKIGLFSHELSSIPQGVDNVTVTDFERVTDDNLKILIVLGANYGVIPSAPTSEGILSGNEREIISNSGINLAPDSVSAYMSSELKMYKILCKPDKKLFLFYPTADCEGTKLKEADCIRRIKEMYEQLHVQCNAGTLHNYDKYHISSPEVTIHKLLRMTSRKQNVDNLWKYASLWYTNQGGKWLQKINSITLMNNYTEKAPTISTESAQLLYAGKDCYSISRLEQYFICPYKYFLANGLKLKERQEYKIGKNDIGDIIHYALMKYCSTVDGENSSAKQKKENWDNLDDAKSLEIIHSIIDEVSQKAADTNKKKDIVRRIGDVLYNCRDIINSSFKNSKYTSYGYEWKFDDLKFSDSERTVSIFGVIDRTDIYEDTERGTAHIRVLDYKTGKKKFSEINIYNKLDFQLIIYAMAAVDKIKSPSDVTGMFYNRINNEYEESEEDKKNTLDGMAYCNVDECDDFDMNMMCDMDCEIANSGKSKYMNVYTSSKGAKIHKGSRVKDISRIDLFAEWTKKSILEADKRIKDGYISMMPYKKSDTDTGCEHYCPYKDICSFPRKNNESYREIKSSKQDVALLIRDELDTDNTAEGGQA